MRGARRSAASNASLLSELRHASAGASLAGATVQRRTGRDAHHRRRTVAPGHQRPQRRPERESASRHCPVRRSVRLDPAREQLDPEDLRRILTSFFAALAREIQRYGGTVDKYIGDAIMAVFGAPLAHEDDAERAISAALAMQLAIAQLNDDLERRHGSQMELRIGINTGEAVAGLLAGDIQGAYTVVGDTVNTAQRFESAAPLGGILVSEPTFQLTRAAFDFEALPALTLRGKAEPQAAYRVLGRRVEETAQLDESSPLVGRQTELAAMRRALSDALRGEGGSVHLLGEAGVGKTRLLREFRAGLGGDAGGSAGRCASFELNTPYALIARLLRSAVHLRAGDDEPTARRRCCKPLARSSTHSRRPASRCCSTCSATATAGRSMRTPCAACWSAMHDRC